MLELPMVQRVEVRQRVAQPLCPHPLPLRRLLPSDHPERHSSAADQKQNDQDPRTGAQEARNAHEHGPHDDQAATEKDELLDTRRFA
ncbi:hypothetical protein [Streptomyces sp. NPDC093089]|uniref:hypothetical protein n=1 Tax=Streptomyces sp. NPDC093089 TaxID=3366024 RepID=UPI00380B8BE1